MKTNLNTASPQVEQHKDNRLLQLTLKKKGITDPILQRKLSDYYHEVLREITEAHDRKVGRLPSSKTRQHLRKLAIGLTRIKIVQCRTVE